MKIGVGAWTGALATSLLLGIGPAGAANEHDAQLRPGIGIGKIRLGMTLPQVRRVLGPPQLLQRRVDVGFGREHREYMWNWFEWTVALRGAPGRLRVVRVTTTRRDHRYRGIGVGSRPRDIVRLFPRARCESWHPGGLHVIARTPGGRQLRFAPGDASPPPETPRRWIVFGEIIVQEDLPRFGVPVPVQIPSRCPPDWRRR